MDLRATIRGQFLHSYIPLLDRSIFIEKTSMMHLRFSFYIFTDFSDPFFVHPHPASLPPRERGIQGNRFHQMKKEQNDLFGRLTGNVFVALGNFLALT
jgi:hypothetical protein